MKQKNTILIGVAVGFGIMAAVLFTQMNAQTPPPAVLEVDLPVAAKDVAINTKLTKDELGAYVTWKKFKKDGLPPGDYAMTEEDLLDKRVTRTVRVGEVFSKPDLSNKPLVEIPPGHDMMTIGVNREKIVGGFALPGSKVDVLAAVRLTKLNRSITFPLFTDMLILAVDVNANPPPGQVATQTASDVSLAVTKEQALLLHSAIGRGADLRLLLLGQEKGRPVYEKAYTRDEIWQILDDTYGEKKPESEKPEEKKFDVVELPVPKDDLPAGTELTQELIDSKFTVLPIKPPAPGNVVKDIREHAGKFLVKDLHANQFVPRTFLADAMPKKAAAPAPETPKPAPAEVVEQPKAPPVYWDVTVQTTSGVKKFRYQKKDDGGYLYLGELKLEDDPAADAKGKPERKPDADAKTDDAKKPVPTRPI